jgi:hypothetical protein
MSVAGNQYFTNVVNAAGQSGNLNASSVDAVNLNALVVPNNSLKSLAIQGTPLADDGSTVTLTANTVQATLFAGNANDQVLILPSAIAGTRVLISIGVATLGAANTLTIDVATSSGDVFAQGTTIPSGTTPFFVAVAAAGTDNRVVYTPAATNAILGPGSVLNLTCTTNGQWNLSVEHVPLGTGLAGAFVFSTA